MNLPLWAQEAAIYGIAAVAFCMAIIPVMYFLGMRDGKRRYYPMGATHGFQQCLNSLKQFADKDTAATLSLSIKHPRVSVRRKSPFDPEVGF